MAKWDGIERRANMNDLITDVALIKQKAEFIEEKIVALVDNMSESVSRKDWDSHIIQDRWLFGIILVIVMGIFAKVIHG